VEGSEPVRKEASVEKYSIQILVNRKWHNIYDQLLSLEKANTEYQILNDRSPGSKYRIYDVGTNG
jgi:hypothetical protein